MNFINLKNGLMKLILYISILLLFSCSLKKTNDPLGENAAILKSSTEDEEIFQTVDTSEIQKFNLMNNDEVKAKELKKYIVTKNDTLMLIAFKLFGDINKWGELKKNNPILDKVDLYPGMILEYRDAGYTYSRPDGLPYLVKDNDTLPKISRKVYGTHQWWDVIWFNNKDQIKNPDLIYAGFVLFYPRKDAVAALRNQFQKMNH